METKLFFCYFLNFILNSLLYDLVKYLSHIKFCNIYNQQLLVSEAVWWKCYNSTSHKIQILPVLVWWWYISLIITQILSASLAISWLTICLSFYLSLLPNYLLVSLTTHPPTYLSLISQLHSFTHIHSSDSVHQSMSRVVSLAVWAGERSDQSQCC